MKKILCLTMVFCICIASLLSCSKMQDDPMAMAEVLNEDYYVELYVDEEDITEFADEFDITNKGVYCLMQVVLSKNDDEWDDTKGGFFAFCENTKSAKAVEEDFDDLKDNEDFKDEFDIVRMTVERKGKVVFIGCEDVLDNLK